MKLRIIVWTAGALVAGSALVVPSPGRAIPAFARKYHTTCARCHSVVPRLNNYGWNFKLRGFHVPGDEELGKISMKEDPFLSLPDQVPLAIRSLGFVQDMSPSHAKPDWNTDAKIELLMGGTVAKHHGFFLELESEKEGSEFKTGIGNARFMFTDLIKKNPTALNVEVGKFNLDAFGVSHGRSLTMSPYAIYDFGDAIHGFPFADEVMGVNIYGAFNTGIGKGVAATEQKAGKAGQVTEAERKALEAELKGQAAKPPPDTPEIIATRAVLDALVKKGTLTRDDADKTLADLISKLGPPQPVAQASGAAPAVVTLGKTDYDVRKGLFYQAGVVTRGAAGGNNLQGFGRLALANGRDWWVGPVAYFGSNDIPTPADPTVTSTDRFHRIGLEAGFSGGAHRDVAGVSRRAVEFLAAYQSGEDNNIDGLGTKVRHTGGFAELAYLFDDKNLAVLRYDRLRSGDMSSINQETLTLNYTRYLRRNFKVGIEYVPDFLSNSTTHARTNTWTAFYDFAF